MRFLPEVLKRIFSPAATIKYPRQKPRIYSRFRGKHVWDPEKCIFCLQCMLNCPTGAIMINKAKKEYWIDFGKCIYCGVCQEVCPVPGKAIRLGQDFEMAVARKGKAREKMGKSKQKSCSP